jgi:hypothetical protein
MKSYVTIERCLICQGDTGSLFLDRRLKESFEMYTSTPASLCDKCRKKYLTHGVMMINPQSGDLVVLKDSAFKRIFDKPLPPKKIAFCDQEVIDHINSMNRKGGDTE